MTNFIRVVYVLSAVLLSMVIIHFLVDKYFVLRFDSWVYWEGSISLLNGQGYHNLSGTRITAWPPLFSGFLALWQLFLGANLSSIKCLFVFMAGMNAGILALAATKLTNNKLILLVVFIIIVGFGQSVYYTLLAEALWTLLFSLLCYFLLFSNPNYPYIKLILLCAALLLCKNATVAMIPAVFVYYYLYGNLKINRKLVYVVGSLLISLLVWYISRIILGQLGSHTIDFNINNLLAVFVLNITDLVNYLFISKMHLGNILAAVLLILVIRLCISNCKRKVTVSREVALIGFTLTYLICLSVVLLLTNVPGEKRFLAPVVITIFFILILTASNENNRYTSAAFIFILVVMALTSGFRTYYFLDFSLSTEREDMVLHSKFQLSSSWIEQTVNDIDQKIDMNYDIKTALVGKPISYNTYLRWKGEPLVPQSENVF